MYLPLDIVHAPKKNLGGALLLISQHTILTTYPRCARGVLQSLYTQASSRAPSLPAASSSLAYPLARRLGNREEPQGEFENTRAGQARQSMSSKTHTTGTGSQTQTPIRPRSIARGPIRVQPGHGQPSPAKYIRSESRTHPHQRTRSWACLHVHIELVFFCEAV